MSLNRVRLPRPNSPKRRPDSAVMIPANPANATEISAIDARRSIPSPPFTECFALASCQNNTPCVKSCDYSICLHAYQFAIAL